MAERIYLAGKIKHNCWRHAIVAGLRNAVGGGGGDGEPWPRALLGAITIAGRAYDYTGPFFTSCDHGCMHSGYSHGYSREGVCGDQEGKFQVAVVDGELVEEYVDCRQPNPEVPTLCAGAISDSDHLFAWIDTEDCFGTLVEIGMAVAQSVCVWVAGPRRFEEMWFAYSVASGCLFGRDLTPAEALSRLISSPPKR